MAQMKLDSDSDEDAEEERQGEKLSPSEERAREAEKRAAWRKARYSSPMLINTLLLRLWWFDDWRVLAKKKLTRLNITKPLLIITFL